MFLIQKRYEQRYLVIVCVLNSKTNRKIWNIHKKPMYTHKSFIKLYNRFHRNRRRRSSWCLSEEIILNSSFSVGIREYFLFSGYSENKLCFTILRCLDQSIQGKRCWFEHIFLLYSLFSSWAQNWVRWSCTPVDQTLTLVA